MCNRFLQFLEKKFSCFSHVNDDNSTDERGDKDDEDGDYSENNSSEKESFKSYSEDDEESEGEDVVESTGRSGTRDSSYEDCYSKATVSPSNSITNVDSLKSDDKPSRKNVPEEKYAKKIPKKSAGKMGSKVVKINQEILEKPSKSNRQHSNQTRQQPERPHILSETAATKMLSKKKKKIEDSMEAPIVTDNKHFKKKDENKSTLDKQDQGKIAIGLHENKSLKKTIEEENKFCHKPNGRVERKLERQKKSTPNEKRMKEDVKKDSNHVLEKAVKENSKKSMSNNTGKLDSVQLHNKTIAKRNSEARMPKVGLKKRNISRTGTFSKRNLPRRNIPKFTSKSIQKNKPLK